MAGKLGRPSLPNATTSPSRTSPEGRGLELGELRADLLAPACPDS
jgi:hypothetical protein